MKTYIIIFFILLSLTYSGFSQRIDKTVEAIKTNEIITIDGELNEDIWQVNAPITNFIEHYPNCGSEPSQQTQAWLYYDDFGIYIGIKCYESSTDSISKGLGIRDSGAGNHNDAVSIIFSPYNDNINGFYFIVSASNVQTDAVLSPNGKDDSWDAVWYSETSINSDGWTAEYKIPYSALRFSKKDFQNWGFNVLRWIARKQEWSSWNLISLDITTWWTQNGELQNLKKLTPPVRLSVTPYISGYVEKETNKSESLSYNLGMDLKYGLSQSFTLDMTLIPDFGQVQSDDVELNLSPYELYYNEKRQFFTESMDLFKKGNIFYSRRIGDTPQDHGIVEDTLQENEEISENPIETQLINSTKISGRTRSGLGIGMLNAMTRKSLAEIRDTITNVNRNFQTQPFTNYNVTVIDKSLFSKSYISLINTNYYNKDYLANVTATEFNFTNSESIYGIKGIAGYSYIDDGEITVGKKASLRGGKIGGKLQAIYTMSFMDDKYDQNSLGYMKNNNEFINNLALSYKLMKPFSVFLNLTNEVNLFYNRIYKPNAYSEFYMSYAISGEFKNRYSFSMHAGMAPVEPHDYYVTRTDGRYVELGKWYHNCLTITSDQSKLLSVSMHGGYTAAYDFAIENDAYSFAFTPSFKINSKLKVIYDVFYQKHRNIPDYLEPDFDTDNIYFGKMDRETVINSLNCSYIFTNKMSLDLRLRHYWSLVEYDEFYELDNAGALQNTSYTDNHDINYNAFNIDMIYRWNFAPGSEFLVNWKCAINSEDDAIQNSYWRNIDALFDYSKINSFSIKFLYYLDYHAVRSKLR